MKYQILAIVLNFICIPMAFANSPTSVQVDSELDKPISQAEIQQGLEQMQQRLNQKIQAWEKNLDRHAFERIDRKYQLKKTEQDKVCAIFQETIDETYQRALSLKTRFNTTDQAILADKNLFIQHIGIENHDLDSKLGFSCHIK